MGRRKATSVPEEGSVSVPDKVEGFEWEIRSKEYHSLLRMVKKGPMRKFSEKLHTDIVMTMLNRKVTLEGAAAMNGVPRGELYSWVMKGRTGEEPYKTFVTDLLHVHGLREAQLMDMIAKSGDWRACVQLLKFYSPERFSENRTVVSLNEVSAYLGNLSGEEVEKFRALVQKMTGKAVELPGLETEIKALPAKKEPDENGS